MPVSSLSCAQTRVAQSPLSRKVLEKPSAPWITHWGLQCANSEPHTAGSLAPHSSSHTRCWQLKFFRHSTLLCISSPPELFHHAQDKRIRPHTVTYSAPACMSVRIQLSALPAVFNTSHWTKAGCVASSRKVSHSFPSLPHGAASLETILEALKVKEVSRKC